MVHHRTVVVACALANLLVGEISASEFQTQAVFMSGPPPTVGHPNPLVRLHVFNTALLASAVLTDAESEATDVYRAARIALEWSDGVTDADANQVAPTGLVVDLRVIVVAGVAERRFIEDGRLADTVLGFAPTKRDCFCGRRAYIFSDRIMSVGYRHGNPTSLLGRVLAHEVGHLLLSRDGHSPIGIMRATLDTELSFQPRFTDGEMKALKRGIERLRTNPSVLPTAAGS